MYECKFWYSQYIPKELKYKLTFRVHLEISDLYFYPEIKTRLPYFLCNHHQLILKATTMAYNRYYKAKCDSEYAS